jgi:uncharacterized membrane protein/protein-disulfide isomerase
VSFRSPRLVALLALVGLVASLLSLHTHYQFLVNPSYTSFCDVSETVGCSQAYLSRYGSILGVPVALFGVLWFALFGALTLLDPGQSGPSKNRLPSYLLALAILPLPAIGFLAYEAFFVLRTVCLLCVTTYVAVVAIALVVGSGVGRPVATLPRRIIGDFAVLAARPVVWAVVVVLLGAATTVVAFFPRDSSARNAAAKQAPAAVTIDQRTEFERWYETLPRIALPVAADGAAVIVVKFTDLQCPGCGVTYFGHRPVISKYQARFPGKVRLVTKDYPLQPECNPNVLRPIHLAACDAAVAVRLAAPHGKQEALEEWFYANQNMMSPATVREGAARIGGVTNLGAGYAAALAGVKADIALAGLVGVNSTPTLFVNGARLPSSPTLPTPEQLDMAIAYELKKAGILR